MSAKRTTAPLKFIASSKGKKVLTFDGHIFHLSSTSNNNQSSYFKCSQRNKGCGASIIVRKFNRNNCSYSSYVVSNPEHLNHLPDFDKIRKKEQKERQSLTQRPIPDVSSEEFRNSNHYCLFCLRKLSQEYLNRDTLNNILPSGQILSIPLNDPVKNSHAFDLLCSLFNIRWRKTVEGQYFDQCLCLPLCFKCQGLYQELNQVHQQIRELEAILNARVKVIRETIGRTESENNKRNREKAAERQKKNTNQLDLLGLDVFRRKVLDPGFARFGTDSLIPSTGETPSKSLKKPHASNVDNQTIPIKSEILSSSKLPESKPEVSLYHIPTVKVKQEADDVDSVSNEDFDDNYTALSWNCENDREDSNSLVEREDPLQDESAESDGEVIQKPCTRSRRLVESHHKSEATGDEDISATDNRKGIDADSDDDYFAAEVEDGSSSSSDGNDSDFEVKSTKRRNPPSWKSAVYTSKSSSRSRCSFFKKAQSYNYKHNNQDKLKRVYTCHICDESMMGHKSFMNHYKGEHPDEKLFSCKFCKRRYNRIRDVVIHQRNKHTGIKPFPCSICHRAFAMATLLKAHVDNLHTEKTNKETFSCPQCGKEFTSRTILNNHLVAEHNENPKQMTYARSKRPIKHLTCNVCDAKLLGRGPFIQHYEEHHPGEKRYTCRFCGRHFPYIRECLRHQRRKHTKETPFQCTQCPKAFPDEKTLSYHCQTRHPNQDSKIFECRLCPKKYRLRSSLTNHMASHGERSMSIIVCKLCSKAFRLMGSFVKHNRIIHDGKAECTKPISNPTKEALETAGISSSEFKWTKKCHLCLDTFATKVLLIKHFQESHPEHKGSLKTCRCGKVFSTYHKCLNHCIRIHWPEKVEKMLQCDQCPRRFRVLTELRTHALTHIPLEERKKTNICPVCGLGLSNPTSLSQHMKKHEERTEPYVCDICGKRYQWKRGLHEHTKNVHLKIRPHKCQYCGKTFPLPSILVKHMNTHTLEKTYKCEICYKVFPYSGSLSRHRREVHNINHEKGQTPRKKKGRRLSTPKNPATTGNVVDTETHVPENVEEKQLTFNEFGGISLNSSTQPTLLSGCHPTLTGPSFGEFVPADCVPTLPRSLHREEH